jgi:hypothetical protein
MSWGVCYSGSNNIHFDFPPIMDDGRNFATWQPEAVVNTRIQEQEHIKTNLQYRQYMQQNGLKIMKYNAREYCQETGVAPFSNTGNGNNNSGSVYVKPEENVPFLYSNTFDQAKPKYGYQDSDLKNYYVSREQLNARMISPSVQQYNIKGL